MSHSFSFLSNRSRHYTRHYISSHHSLKKSHQQQHKQQVSFRGNHHLLHAVAKNQNQQSFISHPQITTYRQVAASSTDASIAHEKPQEQQQPTEETTKFVPRNFQPYPFEYHQELTLEVLSLTNRGIGICRVDIDPNQQPPPLPQSNTKRRRGRKNNKNTKDNVDENDINIQQQTKQNGWVVMVPNVIPGEIIKCQIYRNYKSYSDADLIEILQPSPNRIEQPPCPMFYDCGGCQYQHMDIGTQREWKRQQVQDLLVRIGKLDPNSFPEAKSTAGTDEVYHYRSKITPHYDKPKKTEKQEGSGSDGMEIKAIGFKQKTNRQLIDVPYCYIATENINEKLTQVRNDKFAEAKEGRLKRPKKGATLLLRDAHEYNERGENDNDDDNNNDIAVVETDPNIYVQTKVKGLTFRFLAGNFFQNNPYMLPIMVDHVVDAAVKPNSNGDKMTHLIDCYCGSGLFCLSSSSHFDVCVGIEVNEKAVEEASVNAKLNKVS